MNKSEKIPVGYVMLGMVVISLVLANVVNQWWKMVDRERARENVEVEQAVELLLPVIVVRIEKDPYPCVKGEMNRKALQRLKVINRCEGWDD